MIKAIILDVDGVIVGETKGVNFPFPHPDVIKKLKEIQNSGIPVALCSAKSHFSINKIILDANLDNLHITDGGAVIIDPILGRVEGKHLLNKDIAEKIIKQFTELDAYLEVYTINNWYVNYKTDENLAKKHTEILEKKQLRSKTLAHDIRNMEVTKIIVMTKDLTDKDKFNELLNAYSSSAKISWTTNPYLLPAQLAIITPFGISKKHGAVEIAKALNISLDDILGVGDNDSDWQFMDICGYAAAMGNATENLKEWVKKKGDGKYMIGESVEDNGIIGILDYFLNAPVKKG